VITTTPGLWNDSPFVFAGQYPTEFHTGSWVPEKTVDLGGPRSTFLDTNDITAPTLATYEHHAQIYSQAFTTPAAVPDLQSSGYIAVSSEDDRTPDENSTSQEEPPISAPSNDLTPATPKSSPASSAHEVATEPDGDRDDDADLAALADRSLNFSDVPYASANPVSQGRNLRPNQIRFPTPCPLCGYEFGRGPNDRGDVEMHLERHKIRINAIDTGTVRDSEAECTVCQVHFLDVRDLDRHRQSVQRRQKCGFTFHHHEGNCAGHHPPTIDGRKNLDHHGFKTFLRKWEASQRSAYLEYVNGYANGTVPTNSPSYQEVPRRRAFEVNSRAYSEGGYGVGRPAWRRSTGSQYSTMSLDTIESGFSTKTTPSRFRYGGDATPKIIPVLRNPPRRPTDLVGVVCESVLTRLHAEAVANEKLQAYVRAGMDASWFRPSPRFERVRCLHFMVEQGLNVSAPSVKHLVAALEGPYFEALMFAEYRPLTVQSRLTQYAFFYGISQGRISLVAKLLKHGILDSASGMPNVDFCRELQKSCPRFNGPPPNESVAYIYNGIELGPCALNLALNMRQYRAASLLLEHGVQPGRGIDYLATNKSTMQHLEDEVYIHFRLSCLTPLPDYLGLLERRLLAPAIMLA
jgi:hypothetical protein